MYLFDCFCLFIDLFRIHVILFPILNVINVPNFNRNLLHEGSRNAAIKNTHPNALMFINLTHLQ